nr:WW domain-binding protein 1 isoform X2 [Equus asinus]
MARASSGNDSEEAWGALRMPQQQSPAASSLEGAIWRRAGTQTRALDAILYHPQQSHLLRELCPGVNNQPYLCESGHCCGETGCCTYYYELWCESPRRLFSGPSAHPPLDLRIPAFKDPSLHGLFSAFKPPAYEDVVHRPGTPPPPYTAASSCPLTASSDCTCCSSASSCPVHCEGTNVEGVSSYQSVPHHQEGEPGAGGSPAPVPPSCRYRHLTGDSGIELCPCPDSSESEPVKEARASATLPDLEDHAPCVVPLDPISQVSPVGLASSQGDIP